MDEILTVLADLSPFAILAYLVILSVQSRNKETDAKVKAAEVEAEAVKVRANAELEATKLRAQDAVAAREREAQLARELADSRLQQAETNKQAAIMQAQNIVALATISGTQKETTQAVVRAEKRITASGISSSAALSDALKEVLIGIVKLTSGQVGQTTAIDSLKAAVMDLVDTLKDTPGGEQVVDAIIEEATKVTPEVATPGVAPA